MPRYYLDDDFRTTDYKSHFSVALRSLCFRASGGRVRSWRVLLCRNNRFSTASGRSRCLRRPRAGWCFWRGWAWLNLLHRDAQALAERLARFSHLNPASKYPQIFIEAAAGLNDARLWWLAAGAGADAAVRFVEAYGSGTDGRGPSALALVGGGLYVPVELYHIALHFSWLKVAVLVANLGVVADMAYALSAPRGRAEGAGWRRREELNG